jgi:hypothetical protein
MIISSKNLRIGDKFLDETGDATVEITSIESYHMSEKDFKEAFPNSAEIPETVRVVNRRERRGAEKGE